MMNLLRAPVLMFLLLTLLGFCVLSAPVGLYDTAHADIACMAQKVLVQAPDHQWDAELHQLLHPPSEVGDWAALLAALVSTPESPVLLQPAVDCDFAATGAYIDSALSRPTKPLYVTVQWAVHLWRALGTNKLVLEWILNGFHFPLSSPPRPFHHTRAGGFSSE